MKQIKLFSAVLAAMLISSAAIFNACSKQENIEQTTNPEAVYMTAADIQFQNELVNFRDKVKYIQEHPGYKSGEVMDADSAILHIETLFNATYSFADERYGKTRIDTASILIDIDSSHDEVLLDVMVTTLDEIINVVTQIYLDCPLQNKQIVILNLTKGAITNNQLEVELRVVIGDKIWEWESFGEDECWWYGELEGDCDGNYAGDLDGAIKIQDEVNASLYYIDCPEGYRWVWGETDTYTLYGDEFDENGDYLMFYVEDPNYPVDYEMIGEELNFHYYGTLQVAFVEFPDYLNKPSNWLCLNVAMEGKEYNQHPNTLNHAICHESELDYAYRYIVKVDVLGPPIQIIQQ